MCFFLTIFLLFFHEVFCFKCIIGFILLFVTLCKYICLFLFFFIYIWSVIVVLSVKYLRQLACHTMLSNKTLKTMLACAKLILTFYFDFFFFVCFFLFIFFFIFLVSVFIFIVSGQIIVIFS